MAALWLVALFAAVVAAVNGADCDGKDCLNGGACIDDVPGDGRFMCLCGKGYRPNPSGASYAASPALCDTLLTTLAPTARVLNQPQSVASSSAPAAAGSGGDEDDTVEVALGIAIAVLVVGLCLLFVWVSCFDQAKAEPEDREVTALRGAGLGDVADTMAYQPFEYTNNPLRKGPQDEFVTFQTTVNPLAQHPGRPNSGGEYLDIALDRPESQETQHNQETSFRI